MGAASLLFPHMASMYGAGSGPGLRRFVETTSTNESGRYDLVIVGGNAGGLSVAISSLRSGIERVRIIEPGHEVAFPELVPENNLDIGFGEQVESIDRDGDDIVVVTDHHTYRARGCLVAQRVSDPAWTPPIQMDGVSSVSVDELPEQLNDKDILVIGYSDNAVELVARAAHHGASVVMAAGGIDPARLSPAGEHMLRRLERERRATILYRSIPNQIGQVDGDPLAYFDDRRTPDLEFDHIVFASTRHQPDETRAPITAAAIATGRVICLARDHEFNEGPIAHGWEVGRVVADAVFPEIPLAPERTAIERRSAHSGAVQELRDEHYNATITHFEPTHSDLWVLRVRPDHGDTAHQAGQYATLGLGYWEGRVDDAVDDNLDDRWDKLIRRSYSISHPIFDEYGYLARRMESDELEFYIVLVAPTDENTPGLTPRLALMRPGDRIFLGAKVAGRYTLSSVIDPQSTIVLLSTGTGEAPHNSMATELLQKGHVGPIVAAVTVRQWADLGYHEKHRELESRYSNYSYIPLPTREADVPKRYLQDLVTNGEIEAAAGRSLDPRNTHVFLCGNPSMIGLPEEVDGQEVFPETVGVVQLLSERGFSLDRRNDPGNIHYEEYW